MLVAKAGHNAENHNHNDVGSFVLHVNGESLLTDPGSGLYTRDYFGGQRYDNLFASSFGHSVPVVGGQLQQPGAEFRGETLEVDPEKGGFTIEFAEAWGLPALRSLKRTWSLERAGEAVTAILLVDEFEMAEPLDLEEALVTWLPCEAKGTSLTVRGQRSRLLIKLEGPAEATWEVCELAEECRANGKAGVLRRASFRLPASSGRQRVALRMELLEATG